MTHFPQRLRSPTPRGAGDAAEVPPIPAASVILLRDAPLEVLMIRRHAKSSFVPDAWVFPGGVVEASDHDSATEQSSARCASPPRASCSRRAASGSARRSMMRMKNAARCWRARSRSHRSSTNRRSISTKLVWTSRWITPVGVPKRFDTYFFLAAVDRDAVASAENVEAVEVDLDCSGRGDRETADRLPDAEEPRSARRIHHSRGVARVAPRSRRADDAAGARRRRRKEEDHPAGH